MLLSQKSNTKSLEEVQKKVIKCLSTIVKVGHLKKPSWRQIIRSARGRPGRSAGAETEFLRFYSPFAKSFLQWTQSSTEDVTSLDFSLWSADEEFIKLANEVGLYVLMLPVTDEEYEKMKIENLLLYGKIYFIMFIGNSFLA